jgi:CRISPR-associated protein Csd1
MILQALMDYYERKALDPDSNLAPCGFEQKEIPFVIVVNEQGEFVRMEDTRTSEGKKKRARTFLVPQGTKKTSGVEANLLWDNAEYVLGIESAKFCEKMEAASDANKQGKIRTRLSEQHGAYKARVAELSVTDAGLSAVQRFPAAIPHQLLTASPVWAEIIAENPVMTFRLVSDHELICQRPAIIAVLRAETSETSAPTGWCLVTGVTTGIERLHPSIKGVWGAQTSGVNIVSFNQRSFESYGKEQRQGENAPVGKWAVFAYTTALNHLLGKDSIQRVQVGDASTVFWADKQCVLLSSLPSFLREPPKDDPDRCVAAVKVLYRSVSSGSLTAAEETRFFILGLAPNAARISIRFWQEGTVAEFAGRLARHFQDLEIAHAPHEKAHLPLFRLLISISAQGKSDNTSQRVFDLSQLGLRAITTGFPPNEEFALTCLAADEGEARKSRSPAYPDPLGRVGPLQSGRTRSVESYPGAAQTKTFPAALSWQRRACPSLLSPPMTSRYCFPPQLPPPPNFLPRFLHRRSARIKSSMWSPTPPKAISSTLTALAVIPKPAEPWTCKS